MKKKIGMTQTLLALGILPMVLLAVILCVYTAISTANSMEGETYEKLAVAADGLRQYYEWDIINAGEPAYEHDYVDSLKGDGIELTLFMGDTRYITSVLKDNGERNEQSQMDAEIWAKVQSGQVVEADHVPVGGHDFYVHYEPVYDGNNAIVGAAWAGASEEKVNATIRSAIISMIVIVAIIVVIIAAIVFLLSRRIVASLRAVMHELSMLADGNLTSHDHPHASINELSEIAEDTVIVRRKIRAIVVDILKDMEELHKDMDDVEGGVTTVNAATEGVVQAVDDLSKGSMDMAESVQNTQVNMIQIGDDIDNIKTLADEATTYAKEVEAENATAQSALDELMKANTDTIEVSKSVVDGINTSSEAVKKIAEAASVIESIASQTNLLSLNASIEAARAGEAGKGFAVVAGEISSLASQSDQSSKEIKAIVDEIIATSDKNVEFAGQISEAVNNEGTVLTQVSDSFTVVNEKVEGTVAAIHTIAEKTQELDTAKAQVLDDVSALSSISEENAASCQETNASMEEIGASIQTIKEESDKTLEITNILEQALAAFSVDDIEDTD
ncbi:MAG: methyl-accepting chemotaxis protein [Lachnospiraceae bacterium]|nr:methyl-accepting chemotaxis protein [Lachnospiraceae bacterium]MBQ9606640.1 methyl-accepting chemotaxis protein [Lachnospiraceae bacterium]